ncbi:MAG: hypothetical protein IKP19_03155 [Oscillospiraceae bacterium]|nr:hypothetical protein [Oscillospiraceae bacterium]
MEQRHDSVFRGQAVEKVSSPEQLSNYLRVTNPGVWMVLGVVVLLLTGLLAWACVGTLETTATAKVIVEDHTAQIFLTNGQTAAVGMRLRTAGQEATIASVETDKLGRTLCYAELFLPDGTYDGVVVLERTRPISFLLGGD